jgi:hypothetical protein
LSQLSCHPWTTFKNVYNSLFDINDRQSLSNIWLGNTVNGGIFMKTKTIFLIILIGFIFLVGCNKDDNKSQTPIDNTPPVVTSIDITVSATALDFGNIKAPSANNPGGTGYNGFTITNPSTSNADLTGSVTVTGNYFAIESGGPNYRLLPGTNTTIRLTFKPQTIGRAIGSVSIGHNATKKSSPLIITLSGNGN